METFDKQYGVLLQAERGIPDLMKMAGAFEMPGMKGEPFEARYRLLTQMETLASSRDAGHRRPMEDFEMVQRSVAVCNDIVSEIEPLIGKCKVLIGQVREKAMNFKEKALANAK